MTNSFMAPLALTATTLTAYLGTIILVIGVVGGLLNVLVFVSLQTFRQNSSAFYMIVASTVSIGQLLTGLLSRVMISAYGIDWTSMSAVYCKLRSYMIQVFILISLTNLCFATIDQFLATSNNLRWRSWCNIKVAYRLSIICIIFWIIYFIPYFIFYDLIYVSSSNKWICGITNSIFARFTNNFYIPVLFAPLPLLITAIFAILAYRNVQQVPYRTVPLVRLELDKQITTIVLVQVIVNIITITPCVIMLTIVNHTEITPEMNFSLAFLILIYYFYCAVRIIFIR